MAAKNTGKSGPARKPSKNTVKNKGPKPVRLYYWPTPNGHKVSILLEELGVPYTVHPIDIGKGDQFAPAFLKISPNNRIPAIVDPAGPGGRPVSVFESGAILMYLARKYGRFYPAAPRERIAVEEWLMWQMGGLGPMTGQANHFNVYASEKIPYARKRYTAEVRRLLGVMDRRLTGRRFLAGSYSIADMACFSWVLSAGKHVPLEDFPHVVAWRDRVGARPAVRRGRAVGADLRKAMTASEKKVLFAQSSPQKARQKPKR